MITMSQTKRIPLSLQFLEALERWRTFFVCCWAVVFIAAGLAACGSGSSMGGTEAGNPPDVTRPVVGQLTPSNSITESVPCPADTVVAVNSLEEATFADVEDDCSFSIDLTVDEAYIILFYLDDQLIAAMLFMNGGDAESSDVMIVSQGDDPIDLGSIDLGDSTVTPENEPAEQNDQDGDGENDYVDEDDDNDDIPDSLEEDCDGDGFPDDYDEDTTLCDA